MIKDFNMLSGIQKVAVLFSVVGESLAMSLIKGLSKTEIRKIRSTLKSMGSISFSVKKQVMEEFYFGFLSEQFNDEKSEDGPIQPFEFLTSLNDEQLDSLEKDLTSIVSFIDQLKEINTEKIDPTSNSLNQDLILRDDIAENKLSNEDLLRNVPDSELGFFVVLKVIE